MHKKLSGTRFGPKKEQNAASILTAGRLVVENGLFWFFGAPVAKYGWIVKKIGRHPQHTIIFDICSVFLKILIFVALTRDFHVGRVRPAADLRATSRPWKPPHKLFSGFFFTITH